MADQTTIQKDDALSQRGLLKLRITIILYTQRKNLDTITNIQHTALWYHRFIPLKYYVILPKVRFLILSAVYQTRSTWKDISSVNMIACFNFLLILFRHQIRVYAVLNQSSTYNNRTYTAWKKRRDISTRHYELLCFI